MDYLLRDGKLKKKYSKALIQNVFCYKCLPLMEDKKKKRIFIKKKSKKAKIMLKDFINFDRSVQNISVF